MKRARLSFKGAPLTCTVTECVRSAQGVGFDVLIKFERLVVCSGAASYRWSDGAITLMPSFPAWNWPNGYYRDNLLRAIRDEGRRIARLIERKGKYAGVKVSPGGPK